MRKEVNRHRERYFAIQKAAAADLSDDGPELVRLSALMASDSIKKLEIALEEHDNGC
jgi:hypothetical protein